jgi:hypothetical protein
MIPERMWMRGKSLVDVDSIRGGPFRCFIRSYSADTGTFNRQNLLRPSWRLPTNGSLNYHFNYRQRPFFIKRSFFPMGYIVQIDDNNENTNPYMNRTKRLRFFRVDESFSSQGKLYYRLQQSRCSGTNAADASKNNTSANDQNSDSSGNIAELKSNRGTDPAFASYLTGDIKPQSILNELTKLSATSILNQRRTAAAKRSRSFALDTNNDKELYRQITDFQVLQKEKSHRKTAFNVNRALIGNVIICTGKARYAIAVYFMQYLYC